MSGTGGFSFGAPRQNSSLSSSNPPLFQSSSSTQTPGAAFGTGFFSSIPSKPAEPRYSERFKDGNVKFRSSDSTIFSIHQKYLEVTAEGFPSSSVNGSTATANANEIIPLTESSATLDLLFQFVYPKDQPDLSDLEFSALMDLAKAAEKYIVYNAINVCQLRMRDFLSGHVQELFEFGATYNHPSLLAATAPLMVHKHLDEVIYKLPADMYRPWSLYRDRVLRACNTIAASAGYGCNRCPMDKYRRLVLESPANLFKLEEWMCPPRNDSCTCIASRDCCSQYTQWRTKTLAEVKAVPDFMSILKAHRQVVNRK